MSDGEKLWEAINRLAEEAKEVSGEDEPLTDASHKVIPDLVATMLEHLSKEMKARDACESCSLLAVATYFVAVATIQSGIADKEGFNANEYAKMSQTLLQGALSIIPEILDEG